MANNGYLNSSGSCSPSPIFKIAQVCSSKYPTTAVYTGYFFDSAGNPRPGNPNVFCYSSSLGNVGSGYISLSPDCEIPGPPLTEVEQIEAINALFPHAVAILAIAWGLRYIRVLVAEWLKERNASD